MDIDLNINSIRRKWWKFGYSRYKPIVIGVVTLFALFVVTEIISLRSVTPDVALPRETRKSRTLMEKVVQRAATRVKSQHAPILLAFVLNGTLPFVYNWMCNVRDLISYENVLFITLNDQDKEDIESFESSVNVFSIEKEFDQMSLSKKIKNIQILKWEVDLIFHLLKRNINVFVFRVESVWLQNPMTLFEKMLFSDKSLDLITTTFSGHPFVIDTGLFLVKSSAESITLMGEYAARLNNLLFRLVNRVSRTMSSEDPFQYFPLLIYHRFGNIKYSLLPVKHFADVPWYVKLTSSKSKPDKSNIFLIRSYYPSEEQTKDIISVMKDFDLWFLGDSNTCILERVASLQNDVI
ncbi:uncharacterized protein LOC117337610 [Pecten maximus]|uniref:uncharacterized protein LOC117337610 n=1 Tax=Pecten maximus TaxID=6579 RepID=UPI001458A02E|nr:uncharacterized protein LOC117337610 [Pecten maximus]XP_033754563.1 uncharacterized protein LOC117337610 [Pecten maximus]XP_033754564.1 uncharacterized protein LOC117337610 [Pecten maximus]XP_033754565.1 uncharacterized protein LOC117337610 [Pecten maximus]XP_033754566.1 uncharacterized protein LOC117337610 [Pecten maximus]